MKRGCAYDPDGSKSLLGWSKDERQLLEYSVVFVCFHFPIVISVTGVYKPLEQFVCFVVE